MDASVVSLVLAGLALAGTITTAWLTYRASTKATRVNESAEQRQWLADARTEAQETRREMKEVRKEAEALARKLHTLVMAIHDPGMTLPRLRAMVPISGLNGSHPPGDGG